MRTGAVKPAKSMIAFIRMSTFMKLPSALRRVVACLTLLSLLFTQLALAAYVCPASPAVMASVGAELALSHIEATPCHQQDKDQPALCHAHAADAGSKLSLDKPNTPDVPAFLPVRMAQTILVLLVPDTSYQVSTRTRAAFSPNEPPPTILHCCFRI